MNRMLIFDDISPMDTSDYNKDYDFEFRLIKEGLV